MTFYSGTVRPARILKGLAVVGALLCLALTYARFGLADDDGKRVRDDAGARAAFLAAYPVFMHPRCVNCHPAGDVPLQGEDSRIHAQNVKRGPDGRGRYALKCANCHQRANMAGENMPPGSPDWRMPPADMPMVFENRTPGDLARQLKDPKQNGGRTLEELIRHVSEEPLVLWGWDPGNGRTKPPLSHAEFVRVFREWVEKGAASPE
jgi:mono/diheme cytochrome c family protein